MGLFNISKKKADKYADLADKNYENKEWAKSTENYEKAIAISPLQITDEHYFRLGYCYSKLQNNIKAVEAYEKCLEITPNYPSANNNLGYCYHKQKLYDKALYCYEKSIEQGDDGHYPYRNKFDTLNKMGRHQDALALIKDNPKYFNTKYYGDIVNKTSDAEISQGASFTELTNFTESEYAGEMFVVEEASGISLYPHQQDAIKRMDKQILNKDSFAGLLVLPTGGGKTLTATYWLMQSLLDSGKKVVWLAHRHELLNQAQKAFEKVCYRDISKVKPSYNWRIISGNHDKPIHIKPTDDIIISSKTSLSRGIELFLNNWLEANHDKVILIIDEAHHATATEYRKLIDKIKSKATNFRMLGLTATPFRTTANEQGLLKKIFPDDIVYKIDLRELINRGILAEPIFEPVATHVDMVKLFQSNDGEEVLNRITHDSFFDIDSIGKELAKTIAENRERNSIIVDQYVKRKNKYKQTIVFAQSIEMVVALNALFREKGIRSDFVVSDVKDTITGVTISSKENNEKLQAFREGKIEVLININILTEGTDLPSVQSVFLTRPTKSTILMTQMIGRALRGIQAGGTKEAYIVSFIDEWQNRIAWVNPEQLFIDENVDFSENTREAQAQAMRLVSIQKIEEFAKIANNTIDERLSSIDFIERIPIGIYKFSYLAKDSYDEDIDRSCNILVYDCMVKAYEELMAWIPTVDLANVDAVAEHAHNTLFDTKDMLLGYDKKDIVDIISFYKQTEEMPQMIYLSERDEYDVSKLAQIIIDQAFDTGKRKTFIDNEWTKNNNHWSAFFGVENQRVFRKLIDDAIDKQLYPQDHKPSAITPITQKEQRQIQKLPLFEIREKYPELGNKIKNAVYAKFTDSDGFYFSALSGWRSKNPLDFQIDHIVAMSNGGLTTLDNLQLLTRAENMRKSDN